MLQKYADTNMNNSIIKSYKRLYDDSIRDNPVQLFRSLSMFNDKTNNISWNITNKRCETLRKRLLSLKQISFIANNVYFTYEGIKCEPKPFRWVVNLTVGAQTNVGHAEICLTQYYDDYNGTMAHIDPD